MFSNLEQKLRAMRPKPMSQKEKGLLWSKIERETNLHQPSVFFALSRRFVLASFLMVALAGGSTATIAASNEAKPGDLLFPVDTAIEKIQLTFATKEKKDKLQMEFAEERLQEVKMILTYAATASTNDSDIDTKEGKAKKFTPKRVEQSEKALAVALDHLEKVKENLEEKGNTTAAVVMNTMIEELTGLAENHLSDLDDFKMEIKGNGNQLKIKISDSESKIKTKFKIRGNQEEDDKKVVICHIPPGNPDNPRTIEVAKASLKAHLAHSDSLGKCEDKDHATSTLDVIPPVISNLQSSASSTNAEITWQTNELATSKVWYSTTTPLVISEILPFVASTNLVLNHHLSLPNLSASTTYYFTAGSSDAASNQATSSESLFNTLPE